MFVLTAARAGEVRKQFRSSFVTLSSDRDSKRMRAADPLPVPARTSSPAPPGLGWGRGSVVHEMTLVKDLGARAHQRGQVLICVVAAEVQLATRQHRRTNPGASAAGVATIRRVQLRLVQYGAFKSLCVHASIRHHDTAPAHPCSPAAQSQFPRHARRGGQRKPHSHQRERPPKPRPPARSFSGLVNRGKHPRTRATRTGSPKRAWLHL